MKNNFYINVFHNFSYGKPEEGSETEKRAKKAETEIHNEIKLLCRVIRKHGLPEEDGTYTIKFGELFEMYKVISNKLVGILLRARKYDFVKFEGEMLYQRKDDDVVITLLRVPAEDEQLS